MTIAAILKAKGAAVATIRPGVSIGEAARQLAERQIGSLVVVDQSRAVIGIFSERDLVRAIARDGSQALDRTVETAMSSPVVTCREDETIDQIMAVMTAHRFRHVPVVEDGELRGIVSIGDVVKHKIAQAEMEAAAMRAYITTG
jgi:CBS domain-containing protein